jgi:hypothetical protein
MPRPKKITPTLIKQVQQALREWEGYYHDRDPHGLNILCKKAADSVLQEDGRRVAQWVIEHRKKIDDASALIYYIDNRDGASRADHVLTRALLFLECANASETVIMSKAEQLVLRTLVEKMPTPMDAVDIEVASDISRRSLAGKSGILKKLVDSGYAVRKSRYSGWTATTEGKNVLQSLARK